MKSRIQTSLIESKIKLDRVLIASGFIGPLIFFFTIYFLFAVIYPGYNIKEHYISELGAVDSPVKILANVLGFSLFGIFIMLFALGVWRSREISKTARSAALFFFMTGILMYLVGVFVCDAGCYNYSVRGDLHNKASNYQFPILAIGLITFAFGVATHKKLRWLTPLILILGVVTLILAYFNFFMHDLQNPGIWQRTAIGLPYLIVMIISIVLYKVQFKG